MQVNWVKTLYLNVRMFPLKTAVKLPVLIYGPLKLHLHGGRINLNVPVERGMVKLGETVTEVEMYTRSSGVAELRLNGILNVNGHFTTGIDCIFAIRQKGVLDVGRGVYIGRACKLIVTKQIHLGNHVRVGFESQLFDTGFHFIEDLNRKTVQRIDGSIRLNDYCWIGNRSSVQKRTVTPLYTIVTSCSILNRDYTRDIPENSIIGGMPARLIKTGFRRVFDPAQEALIHAYFDKTNDKELKTDTDC